MTSEWMKVMLEEIERKRSEAEQARLEHERRAGESPADGRTEMPRAGGAASRTAGG